MKKETIKELPITRYQQQLRDDMIKWIYLRSGWKPTLQDIVTIMNSRITRSRVHQIIKTDLKV